MNQFWAEQSLRYVWHPCTQMQHHEVFPPIPISHAQGAWLYDMDGKKYLDGISSWWVNLLGHGHPHIVQALKKQLDTLEHVMLAGLTHEPVISLSKQLSAQTGYALGHCFFGSDGAAAIEIALKMSFHHWQNKGLSSKRTFICLQGSYHGETIGALAVTDVPLFRTTYDDLLQKNHVVMSPDSRRAAADKSDPGCVYSALKEVEDLLKSRADDIAAIIVEPLVQCASGFNMYDPSYLTGLKTLCEQYNIHLIADEIAVGFGRTGTFFACEQAHIWPDFLCLSKGLTGGYLPLSVVLTTDDIFHSFYHSDIQRGFLHSHSYTGNPLACRAALATLAVMNEQCILEANKIVAEKMHRALFPIKALPYVAHFRACGMLWAFDVIDAPAHFASRFSHVALKKGLLLRPIGHTVYLMPPYIVNDEEIALLGEGTLSVLKEVMCS